MIGPKLSRSIDLLSFAMVVIFGLGWAAERYDWLAPRPFTDVDNVQLSWEEDKHLLLIYAEYIKTNAPCKLDPPLVVFGWFFGKREPLGYSAIRGANQTEQRIEGFQTMRLQVAIGQLPIDHVEVWTRHICEDGDGGTYTLDTTLLDEKVPPTN